MTDTPERERSDDADGEPDADGAQEVPESVVEEARRLTKRARRAVDEAEATAYRERRDRLLGEYGFTARVRTDDGDDVLVCYPAEWIDDGVVDLDRVEDVDRGVERPLEGPGDEQSWEAVHAENEAVVDALDADPVHVENARALATFASNHYAKPIAALTAAELREFLEEYFPRNAFPSDEQREVIEDSVRLVYEHLDVRLPDDLF